MLHRWELATKDIGSIGVAGRLVTQGGKVFELHARFSPGRYMLEYHDDDSDSILSALADAKGWDLFGVSPVSADRVFVSETEGGIQTWQYVVSSGYTYRVRLSGRPMRMLSRDLFDARGKLRARFIYDRFDGITTEAAFPRSIRVLGPEDEAILEIAAEQIASLPPLAAPRAHVSSADDDAEATVGQLWRAWNDAKPENQGGLTSEESSRFAAATLALLRVMDRIDEEEAAALLVQAIALDPQNPVLAGLAVERARLMHDDTGALHAARRYARALVDDTVAWISVGSLLEDMNRLDEAESLYDSMARLYPDEPEFRLILGTLRFHRKRWVEGEDVFDLLTDWLDTSGIDPVARARYANAMAAVYADVNISLAKARRLNDYALTVDRDDPFYLDTLGVLLWRDGNKSAAIATFQRALDRKDHPLIRGHMARAQGRR